jgi:hypothetical protein
VLVQPGATYTFSAWIRRENVTAAGNFYFPLSASHAERAEVPAGTEDWEQMTWEYTMPATQSSFRMRVLARGPGTVWFDQLTMTKAGSSQNLLANPSFDDFDAPPGLLSFSQEALVYQTGDVSVDLEAKDSAVDWALRADTGQQVASGTAPVAGGTTSVDLGDIAPGYYTFEARVDEPEPATRVGTIAVVDEASPHRTAEHPIGIALQARRNSVPEVDALMGPLGAGEARQGHSWIDIEKTPGVYDFTGLAHDQIEATFARGERPLLITPQRSPLYDDGRTPSTPEGLAAYARVNKAMSEFYGDTVDYEIYNEFNHTANNGACGPTPECYMDLLVPTAAAIREATPEANIVAPGIAGLNLPWLRELFELGGLDHIDTLSFHTYDVPQQPEGETEKEMAQLLALLAEYGREDMPIWMTEHGWHTQVGGATEQLQGAYTVRSAVLLQAAGVDQVHYYTLADTGLDPAEKEHNFGLTRSNLGVNSAIAVKPAYPSLAVFNRLTAGREYERLGRAGGAYMGVFSDADLPQTRVLWAPDGETVRVTLSDEIQVVEPTGRTWTAGTAGQDLQLTLGDQPVYLVGEVVGVNAASAPALSVQRPDAIARGAAPELPVTLDRAALGLTGEVTVSSTAGESTTVAGAAGSLPLEPFEETGLLPLRIAASTADGLAALDVGEIEVRDNPALTVVPSTDAATGLGLTSLRADSLAGSASAELGETTWQIGDRSGEAAAVEVPGGEQVSIELERDVEPWQPESYRVSTTVDGEPREVTGTTVFAPVAAVGTPPPPAGDWNTHARWVSIGGGVTDDADLGGSFSLGWDADGLEVSATVNDDDHSSGPSPAELWAGDSLQFAASPGAPGSTTARRELGAALLDSGPTLRSFAPVGDVSAGSVDVTRDDAASTTRYEITVPWAALGVTPDEPFSFSMVLNDADAGVREGYREWGSGIGGRKETAYFLPLTLLAAPPALASLSVDGQSVADFDPNTLTYTARALAGGPVPQVSATANADARVKIVQAPAAPGTAVVTVTAGDAAREYRVEFERVVGQDARVSVEVGCDDETRAPVVTVRNDAAHASDVRVASTLGDRRQAAVAPGATASFALAHSEDPASAEVSAYVPFAAPDRAASYTWQKITVDPCE